MYQNYLLIISLVCCFILVCLLLIFSVACIGISKKIELHLNELGDI